MATDRTASVATLAWVGGVDGYLTLIDQTLLPTELKTIECRTAQSVWEAIKTLRVRGAPAIGIAAAYGVVLGLQGVVLQEEAKFLTQLNLVVDELATSRPTAVNLFWALNRMQSRAEALRHKMSPREILTVLLAEARAIEEQDRKECRQIGQFGEALLRDGQGVMTHCNAGGLATADYGTALAVFFAAQEAGKRLHVYADETRPLLQGARLTAWELHQRGIDVTLICDSMAAQVMREGRVSGGCDRRRPNCRQRRHGQQDRHVWRGGPGRRARHSVLCRRAHEHVRSVDFLGRSDSDRTARSAGDHARLWPANGPGWH